MRTAATPILRSEFNSEIALSNISWSIKSFARRIVFSRSARILFFASFLLLEHPLAQRRIIIIAKRINNEEKVLEKQLNGYIEYKKKFLNDIIIMNKE